MAQIRGGQFKITGSLRKALCHAGCSLSRGGNLYRLNKAGIFLDSDFCFAGVTGTNLLIDTPLPSEAAVLGEAAACFLLPVEFGIVQAGGCRQNSSVPFGAGRRRLRRALHPRRPGFAILALDHAVFSMVFILVPDAQSHFNIYHAAGPLSPSS